MYDATKLPMEQFSGPALTENEQRIRRKRGICVHNGAIWCRNWTRCAKCGWFPELNPEVRRARVDAVLAQDDKTLADRVALMRQRLLEKWKKEEDPDDQTV